MSQNSDDWYQFGLFRLDAGERRLLREGKAVPLPPKAFDLLLVLVKNHGHRMGKDELLKSVWPDMFVDEANLPTNVSLIRKALGENGDEQRYIETVPKHGYRFLADVRKASDGQPTSILETQLEQQERPVASNASVVRPAALVALAVGVGALVWLMVTRQMSGPASTTLRVVPLTSYEGAERFPSFSPDGSHVAFAWDGRQQDNYEIYTRPLGQEAAFRLTDDPAMDLSPAWSPDGRWIAFLRLRPAGRATVVLTTPLSRAERPLTEIAAPWIRVGFFGAFLAWSPDSKWIATADKISSEVPFGLVRISLETGEKRPLTLPPRGYNDIAPAFSPDGRSLAFVGIMSFAVSELHLLRLGGDLAPSGEPLRLSFENQRTTSPVWSQDGREVFVASGDVFSSRLFRIAAIRPAGLARSNRWRGRSRSGDFPFDRPTRLRAGIFDPNIWRVQVDPDRRVIGSPVSLISSTRVDFSQQFSPDGKRVAFMSNRSGPTEVWVADSDGANASQADIGCRSPDRMPAMVPGRRTDRFPVERQGPIGCRPDQCPGRDVGANHV